ncbi:MAG: hypothetical protein ACRD0W_24625 [Acidimicrobiales bacterium]
MTEQGARSAVGAEGDGIDVVDRNLDLLRTAARWEYFTWAPLYVCCWRRR